MGKKVKAKVLILEQATRAQRERRGKALLLL
jgi:hypothetical protein